VAVPPAALSIRSGDAERKVARLASRDSDSGRTATLPREGAGVGGNAGRAKGGAVPDAGLGTAGCGAVAGVVVRASATATEDETGAPPIAAGGPWGLESVAVEAGVGTFKVESEVISGALEEGMSCRTIMSPRTTTAVALSALRPAGRISHCSQAGSGLEADCGG
jgi:hypothetical protein